MLPSAALAHDDPTQRARAAEMRRLELQIMLERQRGLDYAERQQLLREQDRNAASAPIGRPEVRIFKPPCGVIGCR